jgi:phosphoribosylanthranilate isomerase
MSVKVKICGITNLDDALAAVEAGTDALGFMFCESSPRNVSLTTAADIIRRLPPFIARVGVFVNPAGELVKSAIASCGVDTLQFHGEETPEFCRRFGLKTIKAFRMQGKETLGGVREYATDAWLLDSFVAGVRGGTGATFHWELAVEAKKLGRPIILAGGLTPKNVAEAVQQVRPYAVDVSSGVESSPGKKDHGKVREFIVAATSAG